MPTLKCGKIIVDHHLNSPGIRKTAAVEVILIVLLSVAIDIYFCCKNLIYTRVHLTLREQAITLHKNMLASAMCPRAQLG